MAVRTEAEDRMGKRWGEGRWDRRSTIGDCVRRTDVRRKIRERCVGCGEGGRLAGAL